MATSFCKDANYIATPGDCPYGRYPYEHVIWNSYICNRVISVVHNVANGADRYDYVHLGYISGRYSPAWIIPWDGVPS
jgi:hypothetical protein